MASLAFRLELITISVEISLSNSFIISMKTVGDIDTRGWLFDVHLNSGISHSSQLKRDQFSFRMRRIAISKQYQLRQYCLDLFVEFD